MSKRLLTQPEVEALAKLSYEKSCKPRSKQDPSLKRRKKDETRRN